MKNPVNIGDKIVVKGWASIIATVKKVTHDPYGARWIIELDWGVHGSSKVYDYDENKTWYRYSTIN